MGGENRGSDPLLRAAALASEFLRTLADRRVGSRVSLETLRRELGGSLPERGRSAANVVEAMAAGADAGLTASAGPRFFGFVTGGSLPAALAADWVASAWDQNGALYVMSPAAAVIEEVAAGWVLELLGLPRSATVGFVTGCQMANYTGLAAARHALCERVGWDLVELGQREGPRIRLFAGAEAHVTLLAALRMLGFGRRDITLVATDDQGRMRADALDAALEGLTDPAIVCAQAGNVNTGAFDPLDRVADIASARRAWVHVDAAFGIWAAAAPERRHLTRGLERADSWATDGHKWLNVPYDCGIAIVAHPDPHRAAMTSQAAYLLRTDAGGRDSMDWVPEASRRPRGLTVYAALRSLGRLGLADLVERNCRQAARFADRLRGEPGVEILNEVVLNQALARFHPASAAATAADADECTRRVIARVQAEGTCWVGGTRWHDLDAMRISVSNWSTTNDDVDRSAEAVTAAFRAER